MIAITIMDGEVLIFGTNASSDFWLFRCRIPCEKKYVGRSLKTADLDAAKVRARNAYIDILGSVRAGKKIFGDKLYQRDD